MKRIIFSLIISLSMFLSNCQTTIHSYFHKNKYPREIKEISIGFIEIRNFELDSFIKANFYDALKFELEKRNYKVNNPNKVRKVLELANIEEKKYLLEDQIFRLTKNSGFDIFIQGYIQENNVGDALYEEPHTVIVLFLHGRDRGEKFGEIRLFARDRTILSGENLHEMATSIAKEIKSITN